MDGKIKRLAVFMPPGHGKSVYVSQLFPAHYLSCTQNKTFILASHTAELAEDFGHKCRRIMESANFRVVHGAMLDPKTRAIGHWLTKTGGEFFAVGVGGAVTGRRGSVALIDDPVRGIEDADSETIRRKTWDWYMSDLRTRLKADGALVLVMTRWNFSDISGGIFGESYTNEAGLITAQDGEVWDVVSLPALAEPNDLLGRAVGEPLWPEMFDKAKLEGIRTSYQVTGQSRNWAALYQQRPAPETGNFFQREWFKYYDKAPEHLRYYGASDYAVTSKGGDWTVHGVVGVDNQDNIYLLDWYRAQAESLEWVERFIDMLKRWKPLEWAEEKGQIQKSLDPIIRKRMMERKIYAYRRQYTSSVDKQSRAQAIQARMSMGKVYFPRNVPWLEALESELLTFPAGKHDDAVDCLSLVGRMLDRMIGGSVPKAKQEPEFKTLSNTTYDELWKYAPKKRVSGRV